MKIENKIIKKLISEKKFSNMSSEDAHLIYLNDLRRMQNYERIYVKRNHASYITARKTILNS